ncbi:hypothetical protein ACO0QE_000028 [Hanseniaspora vineae]
MPEPQFKTGDLVLCKVGSYEPWPSVVFPQKLLASDVYSKRKPGKIVVRFFQDQTYSWSLAKRLIPLSKDDIKQFLKDNKKSSRINRDLYEAYKEALEYDNLHEYLFNLDEESVEFEIVKQYLQDTGADEIKGGEDPYKGKPNYMNVNGNGNNKRKKNMNNGIKKQKYTADEEEEEEEQEEVNGNEKENGDTHENSQSDLSAKTKDALKYSRLKEASSLSPTSNSPLGSPSTNLDKPLKQKRIILNYDKRLETCLLFRRKIQIALIQRDSPPTEEQLKTVDGYFKTIYERSKQDSIIKSDLKKEDEDSKSLDSKQGNDENGADTVNSNSDAAQTFSSFKNNDKVFFDLPSLRQSKLPKLLKTIINTSSLQAYHTICKKILIEWQDYVEILKKEKKESKNTQSLIKSE